MLKALELIGFKSFADKTRFEFPAGITVVVGPNGSGKSNIVDAIKWVLGEQSAKSLRGKDMADVIFKGAGEGSRRMLNTAEATIIFDNADGRLAVDATEVHVTRRVYRSGEGEYLVNRQPCRLKDIKDLFRGTGVGTDAYSLIEQGKVDRMLQASPRDRRAIFEEAAGISRFKAKKIEAQRRLERVDQNLLRLSDIVDEVENRLRSVRSQASKARRYREYSNRLQQLRTQVGMADWRQLSDELDGIEAELGQMRNRAGEVSAQAESIEAQLLELEVEVANSVESIRLAENRIAHNREQIAARESSIQEASTHCGELYEAQSRHRRQLAGMTGRAGDLHERLRTANSGLQQAELGHGEIRSRLESLERATAASAGQLDRLRSENEARRREYLEQVRQVAALTHRIGSLELQRDSTEASAQRTQQRLTALEQTSRTCADRLSESKNAETELANRVELGRANLSTAQQHLDQTEEQLSETRDRLSQTQQKFSAANERATVLDELEENQEGLTAGVREILRLAQQAEDGPLAEVQGLVADLLQVGFESAPIVDVALGETAQYIALAGNLLIEDIQTGRFLPDSRVGFVRLDEDVPERRLVDFSGRDGVVGRLDRLVSCDERIAGLVERLLGDTWLVESLEIALALRTTEGSAVRLVTVAGDLIERDGAVLVGPRTAATTLVSRRSELRQLKQEASDQQQRIHRLKDDFERLQGARRQQATAVRQLDQELTETSNVLGESRVQSKGLLERHEQLTGQQAGLAAELQQAGAEQDTATNELAISRTALAELESTVSTLEAALKQADQEIERADAKREHQSVEATTAKVELARSEQQLETFQNQMLQFQEDRRERSQAISEIQSQLRNCLDRIQASERSILRSRGELAEIYLNRERLARGALLEVERRQELLGQKTGLVQQTQSLRRERQELDNRQHQRELAAGEVRHQRNTLTDRFREDYGIEIADCETNPTAEELRERDEVDGEIAELRRKISNIGAVNTDALEELDDLENRFASLSGQFQDLREAKEALERIIQKINGDSRRLFEETLEVIRGNFQGLYRKAFGGGRADLVLEEGVDVLEAGVDIIATPPGKPSFNNSLLSGGEKALTAVSLLLAIFQYRPSPFCVLDEVDAPFDEANIGRFIDVLKGFLGWTKFVVVTHSKKTMTAATTLYGVTMQESGVSKRVSVRFEDVSEDGHISQEAIDRQDSDGGDDERGAA